MGGAFYVPGNSSASAEFNWWADPEAAKISVRSKWGDPNSKTFKAYGNQVISGLEANEHTGGMPEDLYRKMVDGSLPGIQKLWLAREERIKAEGGTTFGPDNVWDLLQPLMSSTRRLCSHGTTLPARRMEQPHPPPVFMST